MRRCSAPGSPGRVDPGFAAATVLAEPTGHENLFGHFRTGEGAGWSGGDGTGWGGGGGG